MPLSSKLAELKAQLAQEFGGKVEEQRLFHLGRELKTAKRSLYHLGLGQKYGNRILHLHLWKKARRPAPVINLLDDDASPTKRPRL